MAKASTHSVVGIRSAILEGDWSPGQRLQPPVLASRFDTSTTVIRESLTRLAGEGLVQIKPNRGFFVPELNLRELADITELRCVNEELASALATERGDLGWESELIAAHHKLGRIPRHLSESPVVLNPEWGLAHREFHQLLLAPCDCAPMLTLSANLANSTLLYRRWAATSDAANSRDVEREHEMLLEAALARNARGLATLLREHYEESVRVIMNAGLLSADPLNA
ncbi:GntR family transcriptional regulator [Glutamicibacter arilaitensis]|uniref:GntR family transcriptional regulator n=1 Tax=Glutamicibacter arilaitensis TaxID=256701 RepID=UPI00384C6C9A